jgi:tRNA pseudouridine38-40 synthase
MDNIRNIKLVIAYQGTRYFGWQRQKDALTVQETVENVLEQVLNTRTKIQGASRTDSGDHAEGQVANFTVENSPLPTQSLVEILNDRLPDDIAVRDSSEVPLSFHSSGDALYKTYTYRINTSRNKDVMLYNQRWQVSYPLDLHAMNTAANFLIGTHDFQGFTSARDTRENAVRTVFESHAQWSPHDGELIYTIRANRFLYHMVRNIVGTLVEVARGRWSPDKVAEIIARCDRTLAGPTAPPQGLCLKCIEYPKKFTSRLDRNASIGNTLGLSTDEEE